MTHIRDILLNGRFFALDCEGDGNQNQRPIEISLCEFDKGHFVKDTCFRINPDRAISYFASRVHGLRDADVRNSPYFHEIEDELRSVVTGVPLVGFSLFNDIHILSTHMPDFCDLPSHLIDLQLISRASKVGTKRRQAGLRDAAIAVGVTPEFAPKEIVRRNLHSSSIDAWMTGSAAIKFAKQLSPEPDMQRGYDRLFGINVTDEKRGKLQSIYEATNPKAPAP